MKISTILRLGVGATAMGLALSAAPAFAQDAESTDQEAVVTEDQPQEASVITVTGSRIRNPAVENLEPTQSLDAEFLQQRNFINAADAINELPLVRGSVTPAAAQGDNGAGVNFVNVFGLGSQRTLTLVNGRRVVSSNTPALDGNANAGVQVDVNIIPVQLIERIDIASIGGAPVYGSDAIAGTVNYILKTNYEGFEVSATSGITQHGDNFRYQIDGVYGFNFGDGRGNFVFAANYSKEEGVLANARGFRRLGLAFCQNTAQFDASRYVNPNIPRDTGAGDGVPGFVLCPEFNVANLNQGGVVDLGGTDPVTGLSRPGGGSFASYFSPTVRSGNFTFNRDGTLRPYIPGLQNRSVFELGGDSFKFADFEQITSDLERLSAFVSGNYDLTTGVNLYVEAQYFESQARELVEQPGFNSTFLGGRLGPVFFNIDNPFLTSQARGVLASTGRRVFRLERVNLDLQNTAARTENQLLRGVIGVRGDFTGLSGNDWNYDISFNAGRSKITDFQQDVDLQNFVNALSLCDPTLDLNGAAPGNGVFPGSTLTAIADAACRPLALFGQGNLDPAGVEYVTANNTNLSTLTQYVFNANVGGDLFAIPFTDNDISFNVGYEFRREEASFDASEFENEGRGIDAATADVAGSFEVNEVFGEVLIPLIAEDDDFIFNRLDVFGRVRYVDNNIAGGFTSWSAGGAFAPIRDVTFRGNFTRSFRAPAITELFAPQVVSRGFIGDLCADGNRRQGPVPDVRNRNCTAFLAAFPNGTPLIAQNVSVPILQGGNPNLSNEIADSYTFGVVLQPRWIPRLAISVDYVDIAVEDPIVNLGTAAITSACFDNEQFNAADPANGNQFCSLIRRDADGQVINDPINPGVTTGFVNGAFLNYEGIEGVLTYSAPLDGLGLPGAIGLRGALTYVKRRFNSTTGVAPARSDGTVGDPEFAGQLSLQYNLDNFGVGTVINYTGEQLSSRFNRGPSPNDFREFDEFPDFVVVDANMSFRTDDDLTFNFVVNNVFNRRGFEYFGVLVPAALNDQLGRSFNVRVSKAF